MGPVVRASWDAREALVSRGDDLAARDLLTRIGRAAVKAVLALNRLYLPHRQLKWQRHLTTGLRLAPGRFMRQREALSNGQNAARRSALPRREREQAVPSTLHLTLVRAGAYRSVIACR